MGKYEPLAEYLRAAAERGQGSVEMGFDEIARLVGGLPESATASRQWWANSSHSQALAWREADYHVEQVHPERGRVRFARGRRGGTWHDAHRADRPLAPTETTPANSDRVAATGQPVGDPVDVHVVVQWTDAGKVRLDAAGKPHFGVFNTVPGLYRMTLTGGTLTRPKVYIGETDNLRRRLSTNYRSPGAGQQTSLRINALLREHLTAGGAVALAVALHGELRLAGVDAELDLTKKAARLLAENAALVTQHVHDDADIANLR